MNHVFSALIGSLALTGAAAAAFNGIHVNEYQVGSSFIADIYVGFTTTDDVVLNIYNVQASFEPGWAALTHNNLVPGPSWSPQFVTPGMEQIDSFMTIGGTPGFANTTQADPTWGGPGFNQVGVPQNAGWFNSNPPNLQGKAQMVEISNLLGTTTYSGAATLVMRLVMDESQIVGDNSFSFAGSLTFNQGLGTPSFQPSFDFATQLWVPTPGVAALLGLACLSVRRRRRM